MKTKAFTLVEALVVSAIIVILGALIYGLPRRIKTSQPSGPAMKYSTPSGIPTIWKVTIEGHEYLGFHVYEGGGGLCHAESCQCRRQ